MEKERFNELLNDPNTVIIGTAGCYHFKDPSNSVAIFFFFCYYGLDGGNRIIPAKRILMKKYPIKDLIREIKLQSFRGKINILANADSFEYSFSYELFLDEEKRIINLRLLDLPNMAEHFITEEEKEGLVLHY